MATYGQYDTAYKPSGALGAVYSGQNAANLEQQNQLANLADLFDLRQKGITADTGEFDLGEKQYKAQSERLAADVAGKLSSTQLKTPGYFQGRVAGVMGEDQSKAATGTYDTAVLPSKTTAGIATNELGASESRYKQLATTLSTLDSIATGQGNMAAVQYVMQNFKDPQQRDTYLGLIRDGQLPTLVEHMALNAPSQIQKREDLNTQGKTSRDVAAITARSYEYTADRNYNAAVIAAGKGELAIAIAAAKQSHDTFKAALDETQASLDSFLKEDQQSQKYKDLVTQKTALRQKMIDASDLLIKMSKQPQPELIPPRGAGKGNASGTTHVVSKPAYPGVAEGTATVVRDANGKLVISPQ
jgi:hypothetical protein